MRINAESVFLALKHAGARMAEGGGGSIILTASVAGVRSGAGSVEYSASKAAVVSMAQTGSAQLAGTNVRVNAICPGLIETNMTKPLFDGARQRKNLDKVGQLNPMMRYGHSKEIASVALFLASGMSSYVNGQSICVDGGLSASHPVIPGKFF
ncbi:hypothetical protein BJ684DRAFT_19324 [Piptocephalis cylindrospora]|uniref:Uncharacterized protein n=1 Tax=Piptocephalis cylindrospora TaxID=1907219 RepID=A0A4P9Y5H1_9FUNG|nr:hypothetical protein BJ684DRAFT_19319 [Piptocephalis cylindrospora]RKP14256.1 hypothetical protein BJ684DRAFT_19324 [Piptocephalis cylindrospora]|eukprot:RKP14251.1 hypothetical protein BJ684DRAFT_19319 [Piptocephalis cylindrospora]